MVLTNIRFGDAEHTTVLAERNGAAISVPYDAVEQQLRNEADELIDQYILTSGNRDMQEILDATVNQGIDIPDPEPAPITQADVEAEQARRLDEGFDYDFGDSRGVHHIGTTEKDMKGWGEVTTIAQALLNVNQPNQTINILTNTGPVTVTATEWQQILLAAAQFRQPIFLGTFALLMENPVPADYATNDAYWNGSLQ